MERPNNFMIHYFINYIQQILVRLLLTCLPAHHRRGTAVNKTQHFCPSGVYILVQEKTQYTKYIGNIHSVLDDVKANGDKSGKINRVGSTVLN